MIVPHDDPLGNRVTPPFRGSSGGPNGGPLLTIHGRPYDQFVTPTGVLPGTICVVVDPQEPLLEVAVLDRGGARRFLHAAVPRQWTEPRVWVTVWMPGFLIEDRQLEVTGGGIHYVFDPSMWRRDFPNIDQSPTDTFVVTLSVTGRDVAGHPRVRARQVVIQGSQTW